MLITGLIIIITNDKYQISILEMLNFKVIKCYNIYKWK